MTFLPIVLAPLLLLAAALNLALVGLAAQKAALAADMAVISALRVRAASLETIAVRWQAFGAHFREGTPSGIHVPAAERGLVERRADELRRALSGYRGRVRAALTAALEANGVDKDRLILSEGTALDLGVTAQEQWLEDESGVRRLLPGAWYRRSWSPGRMDGQPTEDVVAGVGLPNAVAGRFAPGSVRSRGRLVWDTDAASGAVPSPNGGFPRQWSEALRGSRVDPHRSPHFSAEWKTNDGL